MKATAERPTTRGKLASLKDWFTDRGEEGGVGGPDVSALYEGSAADEKREMKEQVEQLARWNATWSPANSSYSSWTLTGGTPTPCHPQNGPWMPGSPF